MATAALLLVLSAASAAQAQVSVTATWDRNTDAYTAGYRLYYGTASGNYQWSVDAGNQVSVPLNLSPGSRYYFVVRAYNASYQNGPDSNEATIDLAQPPPAPAPTAQITASLTSPTTAAVTWQTTNAITATLNGTGVALSGSTTVAVSAQTTFTLIATAADGRTATSTATVTPPAAPGAPNTMTSYVSGSRVTLSWRPPTAGGAPTHYLLYVGTSAGGTDVANGLAVGNALTVSGDLPRGRYYARVRAANAVGLSPDSNQVLFRIGRRLQTPGGFTVTWQGTVATLTWTAPATLAPEDTPAGYVLEAGTASGLSDVATVNLGNVTSYRADVPAGTFYVRVYAVNGEGDSDPTAELVLTAPGAPRAPTALSAGGTGATVDLRWTAPAGGVAPTGYVIEAGSAPGRSDLAVLQVGSVTRFTTTAPPGVYYVRVRGVNARGPGEASNEIVVRR